MSSVVKKFLGFRKMYELNLNESLARFLVTLYRALYVISASLVYARVNLRMSMFYLIIHSYLFYSSRCK